MLYLQIKEEYDGAGVIWRSDGVTYISGFVIGGELYTIREAREKCIPNLYCREISTPKNNTYKTFGVRKLIDEENVEVINESRW